MHKMKRRLVAASVFSDKRKWPLEPIKDILRTMPQSRDLMALCKYIPREKEGEGEEDATPSPRNQKIAVENRCHSRGLYFRRKQNAKKYLVKNYEVNFPRRFWSKNLKIFFIFDPNAKNFAEWLANVDYLAFFYKLQPIFSRIFIPFPIVLDLSHFWTFW